LFLVLCGEGRLKVYQKEPYGEINIFINHTYDPMKQIVPDIQNKSYTEAMESDDSHF
jgi:chromatin segregation and condensation protein Rec8/ScpA/Scc1 (kleisin family)